MRRAFTLVELMVVIAIIALLIAMLLPSLTAARYRAKVMVCMSNLRQVGTGVMAYGADNRGFYPNGYVSGYTPNADGKYGRDNLYSWAVFQSDSAGKQSLVAIMDDYYNGVSGMAKTFTCGLAKSEWDRRTWSSDRLYPSTNSGLQSYSLMWNIQGRDIWGVKKGMYRIGERWQQGRRAAAYENMWFNVVAGDMLSPWQYGGARATHYELGAPASFKATTTCIGYEYFVPTNGNFLTDDGAVKNHGNMWPGYPGVAATAGYLVPAQYATSRP